jgi:septum formation inhibitor MinC
MIVRISSSHPLLRAVIAMALLVLGIGLSGCADMSDSMSTAFADPAKYEFYDCKQLEAERKSLANRTAELQGLMAKAEAELAYRNDYIALRGQARFAEEAWQRNKCRATPPSAAAPAAPSAPAANARVAPRPVRSGSAVY